MNGHFACKCKILMKNSKKLSALLLGKQISLPILSSAGSEGKLSSMHLLCCRHENQLRVAGVLDYFFFLISTNVELEK